ncbi:hypothetical protein FAM18132_00025 [Lacticaseibacillus paracasei]|uniref:Uncharacterized protein n=1 Tax=Lacticaseibacillus paracasei TaxID=1597 RepID=A0A422LY16_LACPA|nr:hypothetical protein FAM18101_00033 [Lacticaseibacillus paracasei]RND49386.1 hypothetical protein FAM18105_00022 [Lacticaseibacillus paracasei]RND51084.1 hypothetical protein FAM18113_02692 [Lacticaseibacillus paracasei]RND60179.1 hypothetical protein FAM18119_00043 [Lacticaseibacillus paracasei]RND75132.1 hypothetical protein FAM18132_00025 [Lacticaseibacillus paracasei]
MKLRAALITLVVSSAVSLTSPGGFIAKWWDQHDAYPNNGIINF